MFTTFLVSGDQGNKESVIMRPKNVFLKYIMNNRLIMITIIVNSGKGRITVAGGCRAGLSRHSMRVEGKRQASFVTKTL